MPRKAVDRENGGVRYYPGKKAVVLILDRAGTAQARAMWKAPQASGSGDERLANLQERGDGSPERARVRLSVVQRFYSVRLPVIT